LWKIGFGENEDREWVSRDEDPKGYDYLMELYNTRFGKKLSHAPCSAQCAKKAYGLD